MSLPIYVYSFILPMSDVGQLIVFFVTNIWTFLLRKLFVPSVLESRAHCHSYRRQPRPVPHGASQEHPAQLWAVFDAV